MHDLPVVLLHTDNPDAAREVLQRVHPELNIHGCDSYRQLPRMLAETRAEVVYSVRFDGTPGFPRQALIDSESLKWLSVGGSGTDHMNPWDTRKLTVTNAAGVAADMMAEYTLAAMLHFNLGLDRFRQAQQNHRWISGRVAPIEGRTILILGLGHTGKAVAKLTKAIGMHTIGVRARPEETPYVDEVYGTPVLQDLWPRADFIVCCVPLLDSTRDMVDAVSIAAMKETAVIIDVSRGGVISEAALVAALDAGKIRGAALDVFATEPLPADHPLWSRENVIVTPHCSSVYDGWDLKSVALFADNLTRYRNGVPLFNIVDPDRGY